MLQKYYCATFVWTWNLVSHTKGTTPTESSLGAEEGGDLNEGGSSRGVEKRNVFTGQMMIGWDDEMGRVCGTRGRVQKGIEGFGVRT
jgi:hypothetical protein